MHFWFFKTVKIRFKKNKVVFDELAMRFIISLVQQ